jgi:diguanylate cyclase (GGDEF)-like protein/putative nucleotidyltransferase with HDIG domain
MKNVRPIARGRGVAHAIDPERERGVMARYCAYLMGIGGVLGCVSVIVPHSPYLDPTGILVVSGLSLTAASVTLLAGARLPVWAFHLLALASSVVVTGSIYFTHVSPSPNVLFYIWNSLFVFYFFNRRQAALHVLFSALSYAGVLFFIELLFPPVATWLVTVGTVGVAGFFVYLLKARLQAMIEQLADAARTDPLTELLNRRGFQERFDQELERARRSDRPLGVLIGDLDRFKQVNDRLGHARGDEVLRQVADVLTTAKRDMDIAARMGGEEFSILLPETDERGAYLLAERLRNRLRARLSNGSHPVTISFGVAGFPAHGEDGDELLNAADQALYAAKELGRDRSVIYSSQVAGILASANPQVDEREGVHLITALSLAEALDLRDPRTARHSQTVGSYAGMMATRLGLAPAHVERVKLAGRLHDIGKIAMPDSILQKPGSLTDEEWAEMRRHPEIGAQMLAAPALEDIRRWVIAHHERPDGRGYPGGLAGDDIPFEARILAIADAYEAMTADRAYRAALGENIARQELLSGSGTQFDEAIVRAFLAALDELAEGSRLASSPAVVSPAK